MKLRIFLCKISIKLAPFIENGDILNTVTKIDVLVKFMNLRNLLGKVSYAPETFFTIVKDKNSVIHSSQSQFKIVVHKMRVLSNLEFIFFKLCECHYSISVSNRLAIVDLHFWLLNKPCSHSMLKRARSLSFLIWKK